MFGKCWDRIQAEGRFVICEYSWLEQDREGQFAHIMDEMHLSIHSRFHDYLIEQQIKDIQKFETDLNKNINKKKKKKSKKKGNIDPKEGKQDKGDDSDFQDSNFDDQNKKTELVDLKSTNEEKNEEQIKKQMEMVIQLKVNEQIINLQQKIFSLDINEKKSESSDVITSNKESIDSNKQKNQENWKKPNKKKQQKIKHKPQSYISSLKQQKSDSFTDSTCKIESTSQKKAQESDQKQTQKQQQRHTTKTKQYEQYYARDKTSEMSQQSQLSADYLKFKPKSKSLSKPSIVGVSMKKIDRKIQQQNKKQKQLEYVMGSALQNHAKYLIDESQKFQQTRKAAVDLIRQFLSKQQLKCKWELVMFGSCEVGYALKESDVDLVLRVQDQKAYTLKQMEDDLRRQPWILDFKYIYFSELSIIKMKVNLYEAKKLSNRLLKKLDKCRAQNEDILQFQDDFIVKVDISMCGLRQQYGGTVGTNNLRFLFYENEPLKKLVFILKDLLRRKKLNETYYGGINSYTLALMVYGIIKKKQQQLTKSSKVQNEYVIKKKKDYLQSLKTNLYVAFTQISNYLREFVPFTTLINPLEEKIQVEKKSPLNIVDPFSKKLLRTNAYRIDDIIDELMHFRQFLEQRKQEIKGLDIQNNKKVKADIQKRISQYMSELEPQIQEKGRRNEQING